MRKLFFLLLLSPLAACELQQMPQQGEKGVRRQFRQSLAAAVRQHHATFAAGNFYQACPMVPEQDVRRLTGD